MGRKPLLPEMLLTGAGKNGLTHTQQQSLPPAHINVHRLLRVDSLLPQHPVDPVLFGNEQPNLVVTQYVLFPHKQPVPQPMLQFGQKLAQSRGRDVQ